MERKTVFMKKTNKRKLQASFVLPVKREGKIIIKTEKKDTNFWIHWAGIS